jgi:peptide/nickel transport system substrate-binding protein
VTSADCIASIKRWGARDTMGQRLIQFTDGMKAVDDKTFTLTLKEPYGLVLQSLSKISSNVPFMMPKKVAETDPNQAITTTIGSGPFRFVKEEWVPGSKVVYVKNEKYIPRKEPADMAAGGKVVNVDRVEWTYFPDPATAANALIAGEVDYVPEPAFDLLPLLKSSPDVTVEMLDPLGWQGMVRINHLAPPFDNPKMRQAMLSVVDQKEYLQAAIGNPEYYRPCVAFFVCGGPNESAVGGDDLAHPDLERAKKQFADAGYKGEPIVILQPTDEPVLAAVSLVTTQRLRQIGINVDLQAMDWSTLASRRQSKTGWNIFHTLFNATDVLDPVVNIGTNSGCAEKAWFGWPCNEKVEKLRDQFSREADPTKRKAIVDEMQKLLYEDVAYVPFGQYSQPVAYRSNVKGVIKAGPPFVWNITKN